MGVVANELLEGCGFGFDVERAAFVSVLHRLFVSGTDRPCEKWMRDYSIDGIESLHLHHLARTCTINLGVLIVRASLQLCSIRIYFPRSSSFHFPILRPVNE